jgi:AcrR family transcriptional regulator
MPTTTAIRRRAVSDLKRTLILDAARAVFEAEGLDGASLRGIAAKAGYTPAALYFHFDSKEAIYAAVLAQSLDRRVYANPVKEIGWYEIELLPAAMDDPLFSGSQQRESVFEWHGDTFDLPAGAVLLARGTTCAHQAFRYGPNAYGLQFHLEMTAEMVADWLAEPCRCGELVEAPYLDPHEISRRAPEGLAAMAPLTERVYGRFAELCVQEVKMER